MISQQLAGQLNLDALLDAIVHSIVDTLPSAEAASLWMYDEQRNEMVVRAWVGHDEEVISGLTLPPDASLVGLVYRSRRARIVDDAASDPTFEVLGQPALDAVRSVLGVPLLIEGQAIGALFADNFSRPAAFGDDDLRMLQSLASQAAIGLENARLYAELQQKAEELELLLDAATACSSALELDRVLLTLAETMATSVEATFCHIALLDETKQALTIRAASGIRSLDRRPIPGRQYALADAPWHRRVIERGETMTLRQDDPSRAASEMECRLALSERVQSALLIPLMIGDRVLGVASLGEVRSWERTPFTADRVRLCRAMADQVAIAIENARLYEEARHRAEYIATLNRLSTIITSSLDINEVYQAFVTETRKLISFDRASIALLDESGEELEALAVAVDGQTELGTGVKVPAKGTAQEWVLTHRRASIEGDLAQGQFREDQPLLREGMRSGIRVPLLTRGRILGTFNLNSRQPHAYSEQDLEILQPIAEQLAIAVENSRLYREADEARRRYQDLYDNAPVMYHTIDTQGIVLDCNQTEADMLGYSKEEIIGQPIYAFETKEYQDLAPHALREGMEKGYTVGERRFVRKDGTIIDTLLDATAIYDDSGRVVGFRATLTDISERKRIEEALRESEEQFRQLAENIREVFWMVSPAGQVIYVSPTYEEILGRTRESLYQRPQSFLELIYPDDRERVTAVLEKGFHEDLDGELRIVRPDGSVHWMRARAFPIRDERGEVYRVAGIAEDITARKGEELAVAEERSRIAREIHDAIIQELSSLALGLDFCIKEVGRDSATVRQELVRIGELLRHNVRELRHVIFALRPVELEERSLIPALEHYVHEWGGYTGIQPHVSVAGGQVELPLEVQTVLFRLVQESLTNVRKHAAAHQVWVTLDVSAPAAILLTVRDDGRGFDLSTAPRSGGLGLSQMRERAEAAGGRFEIRSAPGEGTEVRVTLPCDR